MTEDQLKLAIEERRKFSKYSGLVTVLGGNLQEKKSKLSEDELRRLRTIVDANKKNTVSIHAKAVK